MSRVSVIVASHNRPAYLRQAIQSLLDQKCNVEVEIMIVDNGSDKPTIKVIEAILKEDPRPGFIVKALYIERPYDSPASIYNEGIAQSTGELLAFLDDDNLFLPVRIGVGCMQMEALGADVLRNDGSHFGEDEHGEPYSQTVASPDAVTSIKPAANGGTPLAIDIVHPNDLLVKRSVIEQIGGFDELLKSSIGIEFTIRAHRAGFKVIRSQVPSVRHRIWNGQRSMQPKYAESDAAESRAWIEVKERFMRKNLKVYVMGLDDPYRASIIKHIPWAETTYLGGLPAFLAAKKISDGKPNLIVHTNMLVGSESEMRVFAGCPIISLGLTRTKDEYGEWIVPNDKLQELMSFYAPINWYATDHDDAVGQRHRVMLLGDPPKDDAQALLFWTDILSTIRVNHYIG